MIGSSELIIILVVALLLFGPKKLPELARSLGKAAGEYHKAARELEREALDIRKEIKQELPDSGNSTKIKSIARSMEISDINRTDSELLKEISEKIKQKKHGA
ncbi:MAG: twin-arginine translocase TatA/TatE family subunit [Candidatus Hydrothermarchaeaceae archaeon]